MNKKLFEAVYRESNYGMSEVETKEQLQALLDAGVKVEAHGTGPFGEDEGATVIGFGKIKDLRDMMEVDPEVLEYDDYGSIDEFLDDSAEETVSVLDDTIGQSNNNYYTLRTKQIVLEAYGEDFPYDDYAALASNMYHEKYDGGKLPVKKGVKDILGFLKDNNKKIALASSSRKATVEMELRDAGLLSYFDEIVTGDMVKRSKPEPDIFLKACEAIGVKPSRAYAIEDSFNGIRSAFRGGLRPIMVPDLLEADDEMREISDKVLTDLNAVIDYLKS